MPIKPIKLPWPLGGRSDNVGFSDQNPMTTEEASNVRGVDPKTGRVRGAQRPGLTELLSGFAFAQGTKIDWMGAVTEGSKVADWAYGVDGNYNFFNAPIDPEGHIQWQTRTIGDAAGLDVVTDREGAVYILDAQAVVSKYNADGDRIEFTGVPLDSSLVPVPRLEVDADLSLYVAAKSAFGVATGSLFKLNPTDKGFFDIAWEVETKGSPIDFRERAGFIYVLEDTDPTEDGPQKAQVSIYINGTDTAVHLSSWTVPFPASALTVAPTGAIFVTCPANPTRNKTVDGFTAHTDGWVPHQLLESDERIWAWHDATVLSNPIQGAKVDAWPDRKFHVEDSVITGEGFARVLDETKRPFANRKNDLGGQPNRPPPTYAETAFGTRPGLRFNSTAAQKPLIRSDADLEILNHVQNRDITPRFKTHTEVDALERLLPPYWPFGLDGPDMVSGQGLLSYGNSDSSAKVAAQDAWPKNRALIPPANVTFCTAMVLRLDRNADPGIIFQHKAHDLQIGILANVRIAGYTPWATTHVSSRDDTHTKAAGWISIYVQGDINTSPNAYEFQYDTLFDGATDNEADAVLISFTFDFPASDHTVIRCNGEPIAAIASGSWPANVVRGEALGISVFGGYIKGYRGTVDIFNYGLGGFSGWLAEAITILGTTSGDPHEVAFNLPQGSTVNNGEAWGSVDPAGYPYGGGEPNAVEKLEGYLAHKWGISHVLPNGVGGTDAAPLWVDHPFGGAALIPINTWAGLPDTEDANALALKSLDPIVAKYSGLFGEVTWAFAGPGVGYGVCVDSDHDVISAGEFIDVEERGLTTGANQKAPIVRKLVDLGNTFKVNVLRPGTYTFTGVPAVNDTITITLDGTARVFTFTAGGAGTDEIDRDGAPSTSVMADRTNDALHAAYLDDTPHEYFTHITTDVVAAVLTVEANLAAFAASPGTISLAASSAAITTVDFAGGTRVTDAWVEWGRDLDSLSKAAAGLRLVVDSDDDIWQPFVGDGLQAYQVFRWNGDGNGDGIASRRYRVGLGDDGFPSTVFHQGAGVALSPNSPAYGTDPASGARYFYVAADLTSDATIQETANNLWKIEANVRTPINSVTTHRSVTSLLVSGGDLLKFERDGSYTNPTNGSGAFSAASKWISGTEMFGKVYLSDATQKKVYDPETDELTDWKAESGGGQIPDSIKFMTTWRGRLVVVSHDDPWNIHFSKLGDALNWNEFPPEGASLEMAISLNNPVSLGESPDIITAFIPLDNKTALIGGDHTIQLLINDPVAAAIGATSQPALNELSRKEGIAFGQQAWTKDPEGNAYFKGSKLGVYAYNGGQLLRISEDRIERDLDNIDLQDFRVALVWSPREEGMYLLQLPTGAGGVAVQGWFWEKKTGGWYDVDFSVTAVQPTASFVLDGDSPLDRRTCIGTEAGKVLYWDRDAANDDGNRIVSSVLLGPYEFAEPDMEARVVTLQVTLAADQNAVEYEVYVSNEADSKGSPVKTGTLRAGFNRVPVRARGAFVWVRYINGSLGERWAHEHTVIRVAPAGRRKAVR